MVISDEEFERHKEALAVQRLEKPKTLVGLVQVFWSEITKQQYHFNRATEEVAYLRSITKQQLLTFFMVSVQEYTVSILFNIKCITIIYRTKLTCKVLTEKSWQYMSHQN